MKRFFDPSKPLLTPAELVFAFTGKEPADLVLPRRAIIAFSSRDIRRIIDQRQALLLEPWAGYRRVYRIEGTDTVLTRCYVGSPNMAALVEELAAFGVREFLMWGYCGAIHGDLRIGDLLLVSGAVREEGVSYHYMEDQEDVVRTTWLDEWAGPATRAGFRTGLVWSCDALYRETQDKVARYRDQGIKAVEMEVASLYAICRYRNLKGIAFLAVSDSLGEDGWVPGFSSKAFREGARRLASFVLERGLV